MKSICTRRGIVPSLHRWIYNNGWPAAGASVVVSCIAFPLAPAPSAIILASGIALAALRFGADFMEQLIVILNEERVRDERMEEFRPQNSKSDQQDMAGHVDQTQPKIISSYDDWERLEWED